MMKKIYDIYFLFISRGILFSIHGYVAHADGFCFGQIGWKQEANHHSHFYCYPNDATRKADNFLIKMMQTASLQRQRSKRGGPGTGAEA